MKIDRPNKNDVNECFEIEKSFQLNKFSNGKDGFFIPGTSVDTYFELYENGYLRLIKDNSSVIAYVLVVPPMHKILESLFHSESMVLFDDKDIDLTKVYWVAKVAVTSNYKRQGLATMLYERVLSDFEGYTLFTATAFSPIRNIASETFHSSIGLRKVGLFCSEKQKESIVNIIWSSR